MRQSSRWVAALLALVALAASLPSASAQTPDPPVGVPEQPHVTLWEDGLVVHFAVSGAPYLASDNPHVLWSVNGSAQQAAPAEGVGTVEPISQANVGAGSVGLYATHVYAAKIPVAPGETLTYSVGSERRGDVGPFTVQRPSDGPLRFVAFGDIGYDGVEGDGSQSPNEASAPIEMRDLVLAQQPDLFLIAGDLPYDNTRSGWDRFMRMQAPLQSTIPTMAALGNHEWEDRPGGFTQSALGVSGTGAPVGYGQFLAQFVFPGNERDYLFRSGPVTFIVLNSDGICLDNAGRGGSGLLDPCGGSVDTDQLTWLEAALDAADSDATPWTVVMMHHAPYSWGDHGNDWAVHVFWNPLFERHGVDVVITAHDHVYCRTYPVIARQAQANGTEYSQGVGPVYVVLGGGGRQLYEIKPGEPPEWLAHGEKIHHLGLFNANETTLAFQAIRRDGSIMDAFNITAAGAAGAGEESSPGLLLAPLAAALLAFAALRRRIQ